MFRVDLRGITSIVAAASVLSVAGCASSRGHSNHADVATVAEGELCSSDGSCPTCSAEGKTRTPRFKFKRKKACDTCGQTDACTCTTTCTSDGCETGKVRKKLFKGKSKCKSCDGDGCDQCGGCGGCGKCFGCCGWTRSLAIPDQYPLGAVTRAHLHQMQTNGEAADFILFQKDFVGQSAELTPDGKDKVLEMAARMRSAPFPVVIERTWNNADPELDAHRRNLVACILSDLGNADAATRVFVSPAYGPGKHSMDTLIEFWQYTYQGYGMGMGMGGFGGGMGMGMGMGMGGMGGGFGGGFGF